MSVPDNSVLRVVVSMLFPESVIAQNVFYVLFEDTGGSNDEDDVISDLGDWVEAMYDHIDGEVIATVAAAGFKVYIYDAVDDDWDEVGDGLWTDSFGGSGDMLPHGVAGVMHAKTTNPDVQAGKFLGGFTELVQDNSLLDAPTLASMVLFAVEWTEIFVGAATGGDFGPGVWSVAKNSFFHFIGIEVINQIMGYQRRRKPGVGI